MANKGDVPTYERTLGELEELARDYRGAGEKDRRTIQIQIMEKVHQLGEEIEPLSPEERKPIFERTADVYMKIDGPSQAATLYKKAGNLEMAEKARRIRRMKEGK